MNASSSAVVASPGASHRAQAPLRQVIHQIAGEQGHADVRQDFGQADQAQGEGVAGQFVDVPADGDRDHLVGQDRAQAVAEQDPVAGFAQRRGGR